MYRLLFIVSENVLCLNVSQRHYEELGIGAFISFWRECLDPQRYQVGDFQVNWLYLRVWIYLKAWSWKTCVQEACRWIQVLNLCFPRDTSHLIDFSFASASSIRKLCLVWSVFKMLAWLKLIRHHSILRITYCSLLIS